MLQNPIKAETFPSSNVVYVDKRFLKLRKQGLFAYGTLEEAAISVKAGGEANAVYGNGTPTNPLMILIGPGIFNLPGDGTNGVLIQSSNLTICGSGKDVTILRLTGDVTGSVVQMLPSPPSTNNIYNLTIDDGTNTAGNILLLATTSAEFSGDIINVKIKSTNTPIALSFTRGSNGTFRNCDIIQNKAGANTDGIKLVSGGNTFASHIFDSCNISTAVGTTNVVRFNGQLNQTLFQRDITFRNCKISGGPDNAVMNDGFGVNNPMFFDCEIYNSTGFGINHDNGTLGGLYKNCIIECASTCFDGNVGMKIMYCYIKATGANVTAIIPSNTITISSCRILGEGAGLAISTGGTLSIDITNSSLRRPNGGLAGSSISAGFTNIALGGGSSNEELPSTVTI